MNFELIRIAVALVGTGAAAWQDAKTSFIDDRLLWAMIAIGLVLDVLTFNQEFIAYSIGIAAIIGAVGYYAYKTGQLGGGDVLLIGGLQLLLPYFPQVMLSFSSTNLPIELVSKLIQVTSIQTYPFVVSIFFAAALFGMLGTAALYVWKLRNKKLKPERPNLVAGFAIAIIVLSVFNLLLQANAAQNIALIVLLTASIFLLAFKKQITSEVIITPVPIGKIEDEDILATEAMDQKIVKKYDLGRVLTKKEVEKLKKIRTAIGIKKFPVYKNLPRFGPYLLAGLIVSLFLADVIIFFIY